MNAKDALDKTLYHVNVPMSWVPMLEKLARRDGLTPEQLIVAALGEELARYEGKLEDDE